MTLVVGGGGCFSLCGDLSICFDILSGTSGGGGGGGGDSDDLTFVPSVGGGEGVLDTDLSCVFDVSKFCEMSKRKQKN